MVEVNVRPDTGGDGRGGDLEFAWVGIQDIANIFLDRDLEEAIVTDQIVHVWWVSCSPVLADADIIQHMLVSLVIGDQKNEAWEGRDFVTSHGWLEHHVCWDFAIASAVDHTDCHC